MTAAQESREAPAAGASPVLHFSNLSKQFGGAKALDRVELVVGQCEVHGLLGQNGSGKSTLIKILAGFHEPEPGARLTIADRDIALPLKPGDFRRLGISFVHQHLGLVPSMSVLENLLVGDHATASRWRIGWDGEASRARALFARFGMGFDPYWPVERLSSVERAQLAIIRAFDQLNRGSKSEVQVLILDEPTPFLPATDVQKLFRLMRGLVSEGASVIFVSHDIDEVMDVTDRVTVLRDGQVAGTLKTSEAKKSDIVRMIVGRAVNLDAMRPPVRELGPSKVSIDGLAGPGVADFSITLRASEIVGLTGLIGSGYDDVVHLAYGSIQATGGQLSLGARSLDLKRMTPDAAIAAGIVLIPGDRQNDATVATLSVAANLTLPILDRSRGGWAVSERGMNRTAKGLTESYDVRPRDPSRLLGQLSGGNQQKVVLAKWFQIEPDLILLDEPTQGVDIGAREQVFQTIRKMSDRGACVLCASSDHEQLAAICDRVVVLARGRVVATLENRDISKSAITELCYTSLGESPREPRLTMTSTVENETAYKARQIWIDRGERFGLVIAWVAVIALFGAMRPDIFLSWANFSTIFGSQAVLVVVTLGLIIPLTAGDYDLSIASVLTMSAMLTAVLNVMHGWPIAAAVIAAMLAALAVGAVNAAIILYFRIHSLIVTLGMGTFVHGVTLWFSKSQTISGIDFDLVTVVIVTRLFGIPLAFYYALVAALAIWYVFSYTAAGQRLLFVGRGREVARLSGIRVDRVRFAALVTSAGLGGLGGVLYAGTTGAADPSSGLTYLLPAFAAAFLGATSINPGRFNPIGSVIAVYFLVTGITGLSILGISTYVQDLFYGGALIVAVALSQLVRGREERLT